MKKSKTLFIVILLLLSVLGCGPSSSDEAPETVVRLDSAADWFIQSVYVEFYSKAKNITAVSDKINSLDVRLGTNIVLEKNKHRPYFASLFILGDAGYSASVSCYSRIEGEDGSVYEYWVKKVGNRESVRIEFVFTKASSMPSEREVVRRASKFQEVFTYNDGTTIRFPINPIVVSILIPHTYPQAFAGTVLEGKRAILEDGQWLIIDTD